MMRALGAATLCGVLVLGASSPAVAAARPKAQLKIIDSVKGGSTSTAWLNCAPAGGTHPNARAACRLLAGVHGYPERLNLDPDAVCTKELRPHAVAVVGRWYGRTVRWGKVFGNDCLVKAATGALFSL
ncbi:protease inhibitor protein [Nonomuraea phyllanthi]|uniref:Protease inhibitor protein n=1 Tax=Nonomuraea phyllanthi TaxID=2219224 RepID=A0A5C4W925_9ACTN|nr:SSI family serine proteinase inhibitor [Nonomuraea phyllanthi]KAB8192217.1 protease inhibitor protein [Nonomuraea phyllanthi]QFY11430.1 protease inhibitor protein [Nonomuraea phyllanthi]